MDQEHRGLRFAFSANAEIASESSPATFAPARVTALSLHGCFLETSASFELQQTVLLKIHHLDEQFEAKAAALYVQRSGIGLVFHEVKPLFRAVLQNWVLAALDTQAGARSNPG